MLESGLKIVAGLFDFTGYITDYFRDKSIREAQDILNKNRATIKSLNATLVRERKEHKFAIENTEQMYIRQIKQIQDDAMAEANPRVGARRIDG